MLNLHMYSSINSHLYNLEHLIRTMGYFFRFLLMKIVIFYRSSIIEYSSVSISPRLIVLIVRFNR